MKAADIEPAIKDGQILPSPALVTGAEEKL
jgi:hypothetical protein